MCLDTLILKGIKEIFIILIYYMKTLQQITGKQMTVYKCDVCEKTFKTTQHLDQHKKKKKSCIKQDSNSVILMNSPPITHPFTSQFTTEIVSINNDIKQINSENLYNLDMLKFVEAYQHLGESVIEYKMQISKLTEENRILKHKLEVINKVLRDNTLILTTDDI